MKSSNRAWLLIGAAALAAAIPALAQNRDAPESLLPEGFGDPGSLPPPEPKQTPQPGAAPSARRGRAPATRADELVNELTSPTTDEEADPLGAPRPTNYFSIPVGTSAADRCRRPDRARQFRPRARTPSAATAAPSAWR